MTQDRIILHSDMNNFYASVECLMNPAIRDLPVAVCGDPLARHGIVLAKNQLAKRLGIITGEAIWQARQKCPELHVVAPDYPRYLFYARKARKIYEEYTLQVEPFGLDESWLDVSGSTRGSGTEIAEQIRQRMKNELGLTVSIGVSFNKIFAKLGSDMKKPDAITVITRANYRDLVWPLPASELLYVGRATRGKLARVNIKTIGDIAKCDPDYLKGYLGKWGTMLWQFANGFDNQPVQEIDCSEQIKSVGNSTTTPRDLVNMQDISVTVHVLSESVASRLRDQKLKCSTVQISVRDSALFSFERQQKLRQPTYLSGDIAEAALALFVREYSWERPVRSIGVRGTDLISQEDEKQLQFWSDDNRRQKMEQLERTMDDIRSRYGWFSVCRAMMLSDRELSDLNPKHDHVIYPVSYFG
ncbi:MAG: polymerase [Clostridiales bacterium]|nr:polymerase [Clostridiales bacterium]